MVLATHVLLSLVLILLPTLPENAITRVYKRYSLIGPFFSEGAIKNSNSILVSWKENDEWSRPLNPPLENYTNFFRKINPTLHYRSSFERDMYERVLIRIDSNDTPKMKLGKLEFLKNYLKREYIPEKADSVKILLIQSSFHNFVESNDTLSTFLF